MRFEFFPLRFEFTARESLFFPPGKAGNVLRGALGLNFQRVACLPECRDAATCDIRHSCLYAKVFAPMATAGPSGFADSPRPFVFRARQLDGKIIPPGKSFHFDLNVFSQEPEVLANFVLTFAALAREGIGPRHGKAHLNRVIRLPSAGWNQQVLYDADRQTINPAVSAVSLDLDPPVTPVAKIRVEFLSPMELKHDNHIAARPEFPILFSRIRDRISILRHLYGSGPLDINFTAIGLRAAQVQMTRFESQWVDTERRSSHTGQVHSLGGITGFAEYEGALGEFLPYLETACWTGVGRQSVWGKGELALQILG